MAAQNRAQQHHQLYRFKDIVSVPTAKDLVDVVLSATQRRTPTQVHSQFQISRIRSFYMRKVKFAQQTFRDKLSEMLEQFPRLDDIHPFYGDLCNVLYDRNHYKLALGQVNTVKGVVDRVAKDYVRLLKYADGPYKCKMLKRAALGRMCTAVRKLGDSLKFLEEVRQHMSRLPAINPAGRSLLLSGFPNVGKSSFMNAVSHAKVEVQPYAFTTKSLFVGHFDHEYSRWQVIDTPGVLDQPLAQRNVIELTAITALAHLPAAVLFFVDISEHCGFSVEDQVQLFHSLKVLFRNRPTMIVLNKCDIVRFESLSQEKRDLIEAMPRDLPDCMVMQTSTMTREGVDKCKHAACEMLLTHRVEQKLASGRGAANRLEMLATATAVEPPADRPACQTPAVLVERKKEKEKQQRRTLRDEQEEQGGPGVYNVDLNREWKLRSEDWRYDIMPTLFNGKNVLDFVDPDIQARLEELQREEEVQLQQLLERGKLDDGDWAEAEKQWEHLHGKIRQQKSINKAKEGTHTDLTAVRRRTVNITDVNDKLREVGYHLKPGGISAPTRLAVEHRARDKLLAMDLTDDEAGDEEEEEETYGDDVSTAMMSDDGGDSQAAAGMSDDEEEEEEEEEDGRGLSGAMAAARKREQLKRRKERLSLARKHTIADPDYDEKLRKIKLSLPNRINKALKTEQQRQAVLARTRDAFKTKFRREHRRGEADRFIGTKMPKHLFSGKRGIGKTDRR